MQTSGRPRTTGPVQGGLSSPNVGCFAGWVSGVGGVEEHLKGHEIGEVFKAMAPYLFHSLAAMCVTLSPLAGLSWDCAFAEGCVKGEPIFKATVSSLLGTDPLAAVRQWQV